MEHECDICHAKFGSRRGLGLHRSKAHNIHPPVHKSRATRASEQAAVWNDVAERIRGVKTIEEVNSILAEFDSSEFESLKDEIWTWQGNMDGTGLEYTSKFEQVSEAADALESIDPEVIDISDMNEVEDVASQLESIADELESIEFPGMF